MTDLQFVLTLGGLLGCGLMAGLFFGFSTFIMRALAGLAPSQGIEAMQSINRTVLNPWFLGVFFGTAVICLGLACWSLWQWELPNAGCLLAGSGLYLLGTLGVTVVFNVPLNNGLDRVDPASTQAPADWAGYLKTWTAWNHVRTVAAVLAMTAFAIGL